MCKPIVGVSPRTRGRFWVLVLFVLGIASLWALPALAATYVVNSTNDVNDGTCDATHCSLREAINAANATGDDDTITFSVSGTIVLSSQLPSIESVSTAGKLTIDGNGQSITISGENSYRVFYVNPGGDLTLKNLTVIKGAASHGGGIYNHSGTLTITNSTLSQNIAYLFGGGIFNDYDSTLTITNSTLSSNSATDGGGIFNSYGTITITNSTLSANSADFGGGIFNFGTANIKNSIVANSPSGGNCDNSGTFSVAGVNFATDGTCTGFTQVTSGQLNLGPLANNGGPTQTHALLPGSVAIDAATDCTLPDSTPLTQDQRGVARPQGFRCDIGAFESDPAYVLDVTKLGTGSGTVTDNFSEIDCGGDCTGSYGHGATVTLTATASTGSTFTGWSGCDSVSDDQCTVAMNANRSVTATFTLNQHTLTVTKAGTGSGTVTSAPAGINCGADCSEVYPYNTIVTLTATADTGSTFAGWSGDPDCSDGQVTMTADKTCTATFNIICPGVTVASSPQRITFRRANQLATIVVTVRNNSGARRTVNAITPQAGEPFTVVRISPYLPRTINHRASRIFTVIVRGPAVGPFPVVATRPYFDTELDCGTLTTASEPRLLVPLRVEGLQAQSLGTELVFAAQGEGIASLRVELFDLRGRKVMQAAGEGAGLRVEARDAGGRPLARGVYLYIVTVHGYDGQVIRSEVRKLVIK